MRDYVFQSKSYINKCGDIIRKSRKDSDEYIKALSEISQWRNAHTLPLEEIKKLVIRRITKLGYKNPIIGQRLKRMPSIIDKLIRLKKLDLSRMQDIGGLRIVVPSITDVYRICNCLKRNTKCVILHSVKDYINNPKSNGYRSMHMIFRYKCERYPALESYNIEIQIRTQLQHSWSTTVESLGMMDKSSYKTGEGDARILRFLYVISAIFATREKTNLPNYLKREDISLFTREAYEIDKTMKIISRLRHFSVVKKDICTSVNDLYYILELTVTKSDSYICIRSFKNKSACLACDFYKSREMVTMNDANVSVLMIRTDDINTIKKSFPNYFLDTENFIRYFYESTFL